MTSPQKNETQNQKIFSHCELEDWLHLFRISTVLLCNQQESYGVAKWHENSSSMRDFEVRIFHTPVPKVLNLTMLLTLFAILLNLLEPNILIFYYCNLSGGVALTVWFTTRDVREEQHHIYMWREQAIIEWSWREISGETNDVNDWT